MSAISMCPVSSHANAAVCGSRSSRLKHTPRTNFLMRNSPRRRGRRRLSFHDEQVAGGDVHVPELAGAFRPAPELRVGDVLDATLVNQLLNETDHADVVAAILSPEQRGLQTADRPRGRTDAPQCMLHPRA